MSSVQRPSAHAAPRTLVPEAHLLVDARLARGLAHVLEDRRAVRERLLVRPRPEAVAERLHVRVRAHARVAEQVPGAADRLARLEDRVGEPGQAVLQMVGGADPGQTGADDHDVEVLHLQNILVSAGPARAFPSCIPGFTPQTDRSSTHDESPQEGRFPRPCGRYLARVLGRERRDRDGAGRHRDPAERAEFRLNPNTLEPGCFRPATAHSRAGRTSTSRRTVREAHVRVLSGSHYSVDQVLIPGRGAGYAVYNQFDTGSRDETRTSIRPRRPLTSPPRRAPTSSPTT